MLSGGIPSLVYIEQIQSRLAEITATAWSTALGVGIKQTVFL